MSNALTRIQTVEDLGHIGQIFVRSGFFADTRDAAQAIVKVMAGQELGFAPIASMTGVYIVKGKVSLSANLMAAAIKRSGRYTFKVQKLDAKECAIEFYEILNGKRESIGVSSFTMVEASQAGLAGSTTWKNFPRNMLYARAMSNGAKWYCPDVFGGPIYTPDELGATIDGETGEMLASPAENAVTVNSAPIPATPVQITPAKPATSDQVDDLIELCDALYNVGIEDSKILDGVANLTGVTMSSLEAVEIAKLTIDQIHHVTDVYRKRLNQLQEYAIKAAAAIPVENEQPVSMSRSRKVAPHYAASNSNDVDDMMYD